VCENEDPRHLEEKKEKELFELVATWFPDQLAEKAPNVRLKVVYNDEKNKDIFVGRRHEWELYQQDSNIPHYVTRTTA
jgi:hypothetical protein